MAVRADAVVQQVKLAGEVLVAKGDTVLLDKAYGTIAPSGGAAHVAGARWRLASITKQVTAALIVGAATSSSEGLAGLDTPVAARSDLAKADSFSASLGRLTIRQLLTHHTGLANPDDTTKTSAGIPAFYARTSPDYGYCGSKPARTDAAFAYNNCDYLLLGLPLASVLRWPQGLAMARVGETGTPGYVGGKPEPAFQLATFGAAGGLIGTARAVFAFDRALMTGKLLPPAALAELWKPEGDGSYQALGQWVFPGTLKGCAKPKRIVQRDGEIGGVQTRNFILPDDDLVVIVFTNRSSDDFAFGEVWEGKGFTYDLLSAVACA